MTDQKPRCETCGEPIPRPVPRPGNRIICTDCYGDSGTATGHRRDTGASHDAAYHGGRFHGGEW